jgi:hypothetical protein
MVPTFKQRQLSLFPRLFLSQFLKKIGPRDTQFKSGFKRRRNTLGFCTARAASAAVFANLQSQSSP